MNQTFLKPDELKKKLETILSSERFLKMEDLGMEVPFFICPYLPKDYNDVAVIVSNIKKYLTNRGVNILELNLYKIVLDILNQQEILNDIFELEREVNKSLFYEQLASSIDFDDYLIPEIKKRLESMPERNLVFLTGVGQTFPYLRAHTLLNRLHSVICDVPLVVFYPGAYVYTEGDGQNLCLFNLLSNDNYYRAYNLLLYNV